MASMLSVCSDRNFSFFILALKAAFEALLYSVTVATYHVINDPLSLHWTHKCPLEGPLQTVKM